MLDYLPREIRNAIGIGLIVVTITILISLAVWYTIKHMVIKHKRRICKHELVCDCSKDWCFKCDGHKEMTKQETERAETPCIKSNDNCIVICEKTEGK